jgi:REP element-mobilizing transposase RayT
MTQQNRDREGAAGAETTYLITWACYGTWLPGREGAVPETQNQFGAPLPQPDPHRQQQARSRMLQAPYVLDDTRRQVVLESLHEVCHHRGWTLLAAHIRTNHIHVVTTANSKPEQVMIAMKAYASRTLNQQALDSPHRRRWAHHGSTRYLWTEDSIQTAIQYIVHEQGQPMAVFKVTQLRP